MVFGREIRRAADPRLPAGHRLQALGSCIQLTRPIGFEATWRYLELRTGVPWREPEFLAPALRLLLDERRAHLELVDEYSASRRRQKEAGRRNPSVQESTPVAPRRWHGDERTGALVTLRHVLAQAEFLETKLSAGPGEVALRAVGQAVDGHGSTVDPHELQSALAWSRRQINIGWADPKARDAAEESLHLLGQLHLLMHGPVPVATPWNFVASATSTHM